MTVGVADIQRAVAAAYGLTTVDILSPRHEGLRARQVAMWLARRLSGQSYPELGRAFERDHSTVLRDVRRIDWLVRNGRLVEAIPPSPLRDLVAQMVPRVSR